VSLEIAPGETLALVGESGCGKSTVGRSILQLERPQAGKVIFEGRDLLDLDADELRATRRNIQMIFQDPMASLDPRMRIYDQIAEGLRSFGIAETESDRRKRVEEMIVRVQLDPATIDRYPHEFSGGQRQRICIARALAVEPRLIVCDESVSALDVSIQAQILNLLRELQKELGLSYLFITHDLSVVRYLAKAVAAMYLGQYTQGLLAAIPSIDPMRRGAPPPVLGDVPSPSDPPSGCRFHTRCPLVMDRCRQEPPGVYEVGEGSSRCFLAEGSATS
jgi:oligopeptide/dipeptide ABC transporter ATP-binding protein